MWFDLSDSDSFDETHTCDTCRFSEVYPNEYPCCYCWRQWPGDETAEDCWEDGR